MSRYPNFNTPYEAGYDSAEIGSSIHNCHFGWFSTAERTREWERGRADALSQIEAAKPNMGDASGCASPAKTPPGGWGENAPVPDPFHDQLPDKK